MLQISFNIKLRSYSRSFKAQNYQVLEGQALSPTLFPLSYATKMVIHIFPRAIGQSNNHSKYTSRCHTNFVVSRIYPYCSKICDFPGTLYHLYWPHTDTYGRYYWCLHFWGCCEFPSIFMNIIHDDSVSKSP